MFVYTVKLIIDKNSKDNFISYLYKEHLPDVVNTGCFIDYSLEEDIEKDELIARYDCISQELFNKYLDEYAERLRNDVIQKFPASILKAERNFCKIIN